MTFKEGDRVTFDLDHSDGYELDVLDLCLGEKPYPDNIPTGTVIELVPEPDIVRVIWDKRWHMGGGSYQKTSGYFSRRLKKIPMDPVPCTLTGVMLEWDNPDRVMVDGKVYSREALEALI